MKRDPADLFAPGAAMLDRFDMHLELPALFASEEVREGWLELICEQAMRPALFKPNVHRGRGRAGRTLGLTIAAGWHMTGKAELRSGAPDNQGRIRATFVLDLSLNWSGPLGPGRIASRN